MIEIFVDDSHIIKVFESLKEMYTQEDWEFTEGEDGKPLDVDHLNDYDIIDHLKHENTTGIHAQMVISDDTDEPHEMWLYFFKPHIKILDLVRILSHELGHTFDLSDAYHNFIKNISSDDNDYDTNSGYENEEYKARKFELIGVSLYKHIKAITKNQKTLKIIIK